VFTLKERKGCILIEGQREKMRREGNLGGSLLAGRVESEKDRDKG